MSFFFSAKNPAVPLRLAYGNVTEFTTLAELDNISTDVDAMRVQSLLICERVLGIQHTDTLFRLMFRYDLPLMSLSITIVLYLTCEFSFLNAVELPMRIHCASNAVLICGDWRYKFASTPIQFYIRTPVSRRKHWFD